jgi:hypothetical protein
MTGTQQTFTAGMAPFRFFRRFYVSAVILLIIPIVFFVAVSSLTKAKGPQWLPYSFENPYNYLFTSLLLMEGQSSSYVDHPGTTTQVFGAIILRTSSLESNNNVIASALHSPEKTIQKVHLALLIFTVLILWLAPWITALALRNYVTGLLIQAPALFYQTLLFYGILFGPDLTLVPFSIAAVCCCTLLLLPSAFQEKFAIPGVGHGSAGPGFTRMLRIPLLAALTGLICAFGIVTKLTFAPLILISLLCCRTKRNLATFIIAFIVGLAFALMPIYSQLPRLGTWIFNLLIHSGRYDAGPIGLPQTSVYLESVWKFLESEPLVAIIPAVATLVVILLAFLPKKQELTNPISWRTALALFAIQVVYFFAAAKESDVHYLIPLFVSTGLNLVFLFHAFQSTRHSLTRRVVGWIALTGLLAVGLKDFIELTPDTCTSVRTESADQLRLYKHAQAITKDDVRVDYFISDSPDLPICNGDSAADGVFGQQLANLYPNRLFFNVYNSQFQTFTSYIAPEVELQKYDHLYFLGNPTFFPKVKGFEPDTFETIDHAGDYYLQKWTRE